MFVWGAENNKKLWEIISSVNTSLVDPQLKSDFLKDPAQGLIKYSIIATIALEHAVATQSVATAKYILENSEIIGVNASISDKTVEKLLISFKDPTCIQIIKLLLDYKVVLAYQNWDLEPSSEQDETYSLTKIIQEHIEINESNTQILKLKGLGNPREEQKEKLEQTDTDSHHNYHRDLGER